MTIAVVAGIGSLFTAGAAAGGGTMVAGWRLAAAARKVITAFSAISQKVANKIRELRKWLRNHPDASPGDRAAAENVIRDLQDALAGN
jgi:hypothetical protein